MLQALHIYLTHLYTLRHGDGTGIITAILQREKLGHGAGAAHGWGQAENTGLTPACGTYYVLSHPRFPLNETAAATKTASVKSLLSDGKPNIY